MSPRIVLITTCSDSPSKLKLAAPVVPARLGRVARAAPASIARRLPQRLRGTGASTVVWAPVTAPDDGGVSAVRGPGPRLPAGGGILVRAAGSPEASAAAKRRVRVVWQF